jgi:hypothetical protein
MATNSYYFLFIVALMLLTIEEGKQGIRFYDMSCECAKLKRMRGIVTLVHQVYSAVICVVAIAFIPMYSFRYNMCPVVTFCSCFVFSEEY